MHQGFGYPMNQPPSPDTQKEESLPKPTLLQVYISVLSAIFGVQSSKNRERDFARGNPKQFAIVYISIVITIVFSMIMFVRLVIHNMTGG
jgi:hypothetical protein